jgi:hypothetical protein
MWTCPRCERAFGANRAHVCTPGMPVGFWLEGLPDGQRRAAEAILAVASKQRGVVVEAVSVGVLIKRERTLVELRPKSKWLQLSFITRDAIDSPRISRRIPVAAGTAYFVRLRDERDVDRELRGWVARSLKARVAR